MIHMVLYMKKNVFPFFVCLFVYFFLSFFLTYFLLLKTLQNFTSQFSQQIANKISTSTYKVSPKQVVERISHYENSSKSILLLIPIIWAGPGAFLISGKSECKSSDLRFSIRCPVFGACFSLPPTVCPAFVDLWLDLRQKFVD